MTIRITHPNEHREHREPPTVVPTGDGMAEVDADGTFEAPNAAFVRRLADRLDVDVRRLFGEGCPFCPEYDGEHVGQHAAAAHPDRWDALVRTDEEAGAGDQGTDEKTDTKD